MPTPSLKILYEDNHLLVVNKPSGLATQGVIEGVPSVVTLAKDYLKRKYKKPGNVYLGVVSRLDACAENLRRLGITVHTGRDWIEIHPGTPKPAEIATHGDHRIVMSFAVTGLRTPGITFDDPGCVRKTFPAFHEAFATWAAQQD